MEGQDEVSAREQHFHSQVRESTICFLLFAILYIVSYFIITRYKRKSDEQEDEDAVVNRISLFLSTFTLAVSAGAVLLLPFSIISNEILLAFPQNYYIQWLNGSLIHGLWNLASLFSNLCLFVLMPFAFFFLESEGFAGLKKGIRARILETLVMLLLLALLILGMVWVASALIDSDAASLESLYDLWEFYLPYLYSCVSLMGCLLLLLCTPVGLSRMFTVMGQLLVKPATVLAVWTCLTEVHRAPSAGLLACHSPQQSPGRKFGIHCGHHCTFSAFTGVLATCLSSFCGDFIKETTY